MKKYDLSLGCWSSGHRNLYMYQVSSSTVWLSVMYMHIHALYNVLLEVVSCCFPRNEVYILLKMTLFVGFISLPSFMFVSAAVSEIHELNQNKKKNSEIDVSGHIIYPFFNQKYMYLLITLMLSID